MKLKQLTLLLTLAACSSAPKVERVQLAKDYDLCIQTTKHINELENTSGEHKLRLHDSYVYYTRGCGEGNLIYEYQQEENGKQVEFVGLTSKSESDLTKLPDVNDYFESEKEIFRSKLQEYDEWLVSLISTSNAQKEIEVKQEDDTKSFQCESGLKSFKTKIFKTQSYQSEHFEAYVYVEDKKFPLNIQLTIDGINNRNEGQKNEGKSFEVPNGFFLEADSSYDLKKKSEILIIKDILNVAKKIELADRYYKLPGKIHLRTDSGCIRSEPIVIAIHESQISEYESRLHYEKLYEDTYANCLKVSKSKEIQTKYSSLNLCKINACEKEFRSVISRENRIAMKSGYVNKMNLRAAGEAIEYYEGVSKKYLSVQKTNSGALGCTGNIKVSKPTILGNHSSGFLCFASAELPPSGLSNCEKRILSTGNMANLFPKLENGQIDLSAIVTDYAQSAVNELKEKEEKRNKNKVDDPDVQVQKEQAEAEEKEIKKWITEGSFISNDQNDENENDE
jgi:hypothetical protein